MSASLVGSEMCIRDRPCSPAGVGAHREVGPRRAWLHREVDCATPPPRGCLLYTSDAADDM
eukprot:7008606-Alexandrium_andersonii.AAC.1